MAKRTTISGEVEVCAHRISWWLDIGRCKVSDEERQLMEEHVEERAKECVVEGYRSGELIYCRSEPGGNGNKDREFHGWWDIQAD